ncbi:hypothetical protein SRRS_48610 [Sporomusa rhizae]
MRLVSDGYNQVFQALQSGAEALVVLAYYQKEDIRSDNKQKKKNQIKCT